MGRTAIIGFGCAGYYAAKTLREGAPEMQIDVYSDTARAPYNPMLTTYFVSRKITQEEMFPFGDLESIRRELNLNVLTQTKVLHLNAMKRIILVHCFSCLFFNSRISEFFYGCHSLSNFSFLFMHCLLILFSYFCFLVVH